MRGSGSMQSMLLHLKLFEAYLYYCRDQNCVLPPAKMQSTVWETFCFSTHTLGTLGILPVWGYYEKC